MTLRCGGDRLLPLLSSLDPLLAEPVELTDSEFADLLAFVPGWAARSAGKTGALVRSGARPGTQRSAGPDLRGLSTQVNQSLTCR